MARYVAIRPQDLNEATAQRQSHPWMVVDTESRDGQGNLIMACCQSVGLAEKIAQALNEMEA